MAKLVDKMLNFVGWEAEEEEIIEEEIITDEISKPQFASSSYKKPQGKVVNLNSNSASLVKMVVVQPENIDDAQIICDHLRGNKPVVVNLEHLEKEKAQRIVDFLSGAVYALDGAIQKVSTSIFLIAPHNVDIMGKTNEEELKNKGVFPWVK